ncbi:MAG: M48 family metalloprotease [Candidatus Binatia bacterium]
MIRRRRATVLVAAILAFAEIARAATSFTEERELGERFALEAAGSMPFVRDQAVVDFVNRIGGRMVAVLAAPQPFDYRIHVVRDGQLNAFAVPGGFLYLHSGLLLRAANDSELAAVLGHEIVHVHAHHIVRQQEKTKIFSYASLAAMLLAAVHPALAAAAASAGGAVSLSYQREFEREADFTGMRVMQAAGFEPYGMVAFMKRLWEERRTMSVEIPPYWQSHPMTDERITNLETSLRGKTPPAGGIRPTWGYLKMQTIVRALTDGRGATTADLRAVAPDEHHALALQGLVILRQGDAAGARKTLETAKSRGVPELDTEIGLAALRAGDTTGAIRVLRGRVETEPEDAVAHATLGSALLRGGDFAGARHALARALELAPYLDEAESDLGQSYGRAGDAPRGFYHLARARELRGEVEQAKADYEKVAAGLAEGTPEGDDARARIEALEEVHRNRVIGRR